jgi:hypothetical protein
MGLSENNKSKTHSFVLKSFGLITLFISLTGNAAEQQIQRKLMRLFRANIKTTS